MSMVVVWFIAAFSGLQVSAHQFGPFATEDQCVEAIETIKAAGSPASYGQYVCIRGTAVVPAEIPGR